MGCVSSSPDTMTTTVHHVDNQAIVLEDNEYAAGGSRMRINKHTGEEEEYNPDDQERPEEDGFDF
jgi:hypothetical protein